MKNKFNIKAKIIIVVMLSAYSLLAIYYFRDNKEEEKSLEKIKKEQDLIKKYNPNKCSNCGSESGFHKHETVGGKVCNTCGIWSQN
jgi:hypothetical protein